MLPMIDNATLVIKVHRVYRVTIRKGVPGYEGISLSKKIITFSKLNKPA